MSVQWDDEAAVVVVGYGGAGAAAAITAADLGASVLIVEKQSEHQHTPSTAMTNGITVRVNDVEKATQYFDQCAAGLIPLAVSRAWAERAIKVVDWLNTICPELDMQRAYVPGSERPRGAQHPTFTGAESIEAYRPNSAIHGHGAFFAALQAAAGRRPNITVEWESPGRRLFREQDGRVTGIEVGSSDGRTRRIGAGKGVILTCGGFEYDEEMKQNYIGSFPVHFYGNPGNTGDGVRMAHAVGADLWHMNLMIGRGIGHFELDDKTSLNFHIDVNPPGFVLTDKYGRRFANESEQANQIGHTFYFELIKYDIATREYPRIPCYWFFDQRRVRAAPIPTGGAGKLGYRWSPDNEVEIARGWVKRADTVKEVAALAGIVDPEAAARSVEDYNEGCRKGEDRWGRDPKSLIPLDQPPFYCITLYPGGPSTCGGPRRNEYAQILDPFGKPIEGLFGAGELGEPLGLLYPSSGSNLCECVCFGQIAGEAAVKGVGTAVGTSPLP